MRIGRRMGRGQKIWILHVKYRGYQKGLICQKIWAGLWRQAGINSAW
eukprot:SAG22_NODE_9782_length_569_cov_4.029787_1_plen_46_part_10